MTTVLRYVWAAPATALGAVLAALACAFGARASSEGGVLEVAGGALGRRVSRLPQALRFDAITFGHVVLARDGAALARCRAHERVHVRQYERWGVLFFVLYAASSLQQWLCGRDPYRHNRFEREARRADAQRRAVRTAA